MLKGTKSYQNMWKHYRILESVSMVARYLHNRVEKGITFQKYMSAEQVTEKLIKHHLAQLIKTARKFLGPNSGDILEKTFNKTLK